MADGYTGVSFHPRPYQRDALKAAWLAWERDQHLKNLVVMPTGTGKTVLFSMLSNHVVKNQGRRVLILAHREELIQQAGDKLARSTGLESSIEKAEQSGVGSFHKVIVGSVQTLCRDNRLKTYPADFFDYIVVDETHRILAKTYQKILNYFASARVLGVTATPSRGDKQSLGKYFDAIAYEYPLHQAIDDGWLSPIRARTCPLDIDISSCKVSAGDYQLGDLGEALTPYLEAVADEMLKYCRDRKTLLFLPLVETSKLMADILTRKGIECRHVDGSFAKTNRSDALDWFADSPRGTALCNAMLLTEGYDQADIDCVIVLRPTKSTGLYAQMIGRGTRVLDESINDPSLNAEQRKAIIAASEKKNLLVLDFLWNTANHRLCSPASLVAKTDDMLERMESIQKKGGEIGLDEMEDQAGESFRNEREEALAKLLEASKGRRSMEIDPVVQCLSMFNESIVNWEPEMKWESEPISERQKTYLEGQKFQCSEWSKGFASQIIDALSTRREEGLCTIPQMRTLIKAGVPNAHKMTFEDANNKITWLAENVWNKSKKGKRR